jgi:hypothetical protein
MSVFKNTSTSISSSLSSLSSSEVVVCTGAFPRWSAPDEAPATVGACGGMGWATSTALMQLQQNDSCRALLQNLYTEMNDNIKNSVIHYDGVRK